MTTSTVWTAARHAVLALPLAGVLFVVTVLLRGEATTTVDDPAAWAERVTGARFVVGFLGNAVALAALQLGFVGLYGVLARHGVERLARWALATGLVGVALVLPLFGLVAFGNRAAGQAWRAGGGDVAVGISERFLEGPALPFVSFGGTLYMAGVVLFAVAIWRSGAAPRWSGVALALAVPVLVRPPTLVAEVVASAVFLVAGVTIARAVRTDASEPAPVAAGH